LTSPNARVCRLPSCCDANDQKQSEHEAWNSSTTSLTAQSKGRHIPGIASQPDGSQLAISDDGELVALVSARSLDGIKTKLKQRSKKKHWGSFDCSIARRAANFLVEVAPPRRAFAVVGQSGLKPATAAIPAARTSTGPGR
jgi:hypothetical protein